MSDCSPLRLAEEGEPSSSGRSSGGSRADQLMQDRNEGRVYGQERSTNDNQPRRHRRAVNHQSQSFPGPENAGDRLDGASVGESTKSGQLRYDAKNVIELFVPVSLCMLIVVGTMKATDSYRYSSQMIVWYAQYMFTDQTVDTGTRVWQSLANAFIMLIFIVVMTTVLIVLYKFRCYKTIHGWLILSSSVLLFIFAITYIAEILKVYNIPMDVYTLMIFIWNFGAVGMVCIHWKGPLLLQQGYLILISALLALIFIRSLPDWTTWTVLGIVSIWDLVAVLCPRGPLRILVETAQERNEPIFPALIYSSTMLWAFTSTVIVSITPSIAMADGKSKPNPKSSRRRREGQDNNTTQASGSSSNRRRPVSSSAQGTREKQHPVEIHYDGEPQAHEVEIIQPTVSSLSDSWLDANNSRIIENEREGGDDRRPADGFCPRRDDQNVTYCDAEQGNTQNVIIHLEEEQGVKLGLGDFIFYSLLVGKASSFGDWVITLSCYVAILVGLCLTLSLLAVFRKALPALPISIVFGLCSLFMSYMFAMPFAEQLASNQVFI